MGMGCVVLESMTLSCDMSMLDCEPSDIEAPSAGDRGGVSPPELEVVIVDERERELGLGRENTAAGRTGIDIRD
jgi:hypothetical protein